MTTYRHQKPIAELSSENQLLQSLLTLPAASSILAAANVVSLRANEELYEPGEKIVYVYFPVEGMVSLLGIVDDGTTIETGMVGREGMLGISAILGGGHHNQWNRVTLDGTAVRVGAKLLERLFIENEGALKLLMGYYRSLITQVSQRCICNTRHTLLERLSCWLLMVHDRSGSDGLRLTQEMMASRVSARRSGITVAAGVLQQMGAIECRRGQLQILDRQALEEVVCECYSVVRLAGGGVSYFTVVPA